jgi:hypothetical protein
MKSQETQLLHNQLGEGKSDLNDKTLSRDRSKQNYSYTGSKDPWTEEEEFKMIVAHRKYKNKWSEMTDFIKGRNNNTIKNKFYSVFRKIKGKVQKADYSYESLLELLEIHYIISLMEEHLEHPTLYPKAKGKRGKDFIYSLIHNLTLEMVADYKKSIQKLTEHEGDIEELIKKLTAFYQSADGTRTTYQTPELNHTISEGKMKNMCIDNPLFMEPNNLYNIDFNELLNNPLRLPNPENSPILELDYFSPEQLASPSSLSAGPAAAAARAPSTACFGGFGDVSAIAKTLTEEGIESNGVQYNL